LSVLAGMCELDGSAKYLTKNKTSFKSVESTILYDIKTVKEHLELHHDEVKKCISPEAIKYPRATHFVTEIEWGASCAVTVTDQNTEGEEKSKVEGKLKLHLEKLKELIPATGGAGVENTAEESSSWHKYSLEIFTDVLTDTADEFPQTLNGAVKMMKQLPQRVRACNDGKGRPLTYVMFPIAFLDSHNPSKSFENFGVDEDWVVKIVHLFDHIYMRRQQVHDQVDELNKHEFCITAKELKEAQSPEKDIEVQQARVNRELTRLLKTPRADEDDVGLSLDKFCAEHRKGVDDLFDKCNKIYEAAQPRIVFAKDCEKHGAKCIRPPIDANIASACFDYDDVYILFDGEAETEADRERIKKNHSTLIKRAKKHSGDNNTACLVTWSDQRDKVRIAHYKKDRLVHEDVVKELENKDMALCNEFTPAAARPDGLLAFKVSCPGSCTGHCTRERRIWTCVECEETLQICPDNRAIYCACGHATANQFRFRCRNQTTHGVEFVQFNDNMLQQEINECCPPPQVSNFILHKCSKTSTYSVH